VVKFRGAVYVQLRLVARTTVERYCVINAHIETYRRLDHACGAPVGVPTVRSVSRMSGSLESVHRCLIMATGLVTSLRNVTTARPESDAQRRLSAEGVYCRHNLGARGGGAGLSRRVAGDGRPEAGSGLSLVWGMSRGGDASRLDLAFDLRRSSL